MLVLFSVFDDYPQDAIDILNRKGYSVVLNKKGSPRPDSNSLRMLLEKYDGLIIGTSSLLSEECFKNIVTKKIILTASVGVDHIKIPVNKQGLVQIINAPSSNRISVAEHVIGLIIALNKEFLLST